MTFADVKPWPNEAKQAEENPRAVIGGNRPPLDEMIVAEFAEGLDPALKKKIDELLAAGERAGPCDSEDLAGRYGDFIKMAIAAARAVEAERERHNRPILTAQRALKAKADAMIAPLQNAERKVRGLLNKFMTDKGNREYAAAVIGHIEDCGRGLIGGQPYPYPMLIYELEKKVVIDDRFGDRRQEAEDLRVSTLEHLKVCMAEDAASKPAAPQREPEAPPPAIPAPKVEQPVVRGDYGSRVGTRAEWLHEITSVRQLPDRILKHARVVEALDKVIAAEVRGGAREIKGCRIWSEQKVAIR